jgi:hypothetical protein
MPTWKAKDKQKYDCREADAKAGNPRARYKARRLEAKHYAPLAGPNNTRLEIAIRT